MNKILSIYLLFSDFTKKKNVYKNVILKYNCIKKQWMFKLLIQISSQYNSFE